MLTVCAQKMILSLKIESKQMRTFLLIFTLSSLGLTLLSLAVLAGAGWLFNFSPAEALRYQGIYSPVVLLGLLVTGASGLLAMAGSSLLSILSWMLGSKSKPGRRQVPRPQSRRRTTV